MITTGIKRLLFKVKICLLSRLRVPFAGALLLSMFQFGASAAAGILVLPGAVTTYPGCTISIYVISECIYDLIEPPTLCVDGTPLTLSRVFDDGNIWVASWSATELGDYTFNASNLCSDMASATVTVSKISKTDDVGFMDPQGGVMYITIPTIPPIGPVIVPITYNSGLIVTITVTLEYSGGSTATILWDGVDAPTQLSAGWVSPGSTSVALSGTSDSMIPHSQPGIPESPNSPVPPEGAYWTGWGRWVVITWLIDCNNSSITIEQGKPF
jgi:hypothetical protein